jgi:hypothetical protein
MFAWFISVMMLFTNHGKTTVVPSAELGGAGNRHVSPTHNPYPDPAEPADSDGTGSGGGTKGGH